jgi:hypothetical protein
MNFLSETIARLVVATFPTGSRVICNPPVLDTDEDHVILVRDLHYFTEVATLEGWEASQDDEYDIDDEDFISFRQGNVNLIVVSSSVLFQQWKLATAMATKFNLLDKQDRRDLFSVVFTGGLDERSEIVC